MKYRLTSEIVRNTKVFCSPKDVDDVLDYLIEKGLIPKSLMEGQKPNGRGVDVTELVKQDLEFRAGMGEKKYGERLTTNNGRDGLVDAYQEILDLVVYIRQYIEEHK